MRVNNYHVSILAKEIEELSPESGIVVDATLGGGGHSSIIFEKLESGTLVSIDRDDDAINNAVEQFRLQKVSDSSFQKEALKKAWLVQKGVFGDVKEILSKLNILKVTMLLADIGVSSYQIDTDKRGFSFSETGPLDMRMNKNQILSAKDLVNGLNQKELERIFKEYGEERYSYEISEAITKARSKKPIVNTKDIVEIIKNTVGNRYESSKHPARRVFQALRIAVNDELGELERLCESLPNIMDKDSIAVILTFHSLERNIVERYFNDFEKIIPTEEEINHNNRAKSCVGYVIRFKSINIEP